MICKDYYGKEVVNMSNKWIEILGIIATVVGTGASLLSGWVGEKKLDAKIDERAKNVYTELENEKEAKTEDEEKTEES